MQRYIQYVAIELARLVDAAGLASANDPGLIDSMVMLFRAKVPVWYMYYV
jgi:hypothetical protein